MSRRLFSDQESDDSNPFQPVSDDASDDILDEATDFGHLRKRNEFVFDPENGGGRRRRTKKVSRLELLKLNSVEPAHAVPHKTMVPQSAFAKYEPLSNMPLGVRESLYCFEGLPRVLKLLEEPRDPSKNTISAETLAEFLQTTERPYLIVDCRFDYEYAGGHIESAVNLNDPKEMEALFFKDKATVE